MDSDFLFNKYLSLKCFRSHAFFVKQSLQTPSFGVSGWIHTILHFMLDANFIFQFLHAFTKFSAVSILFVVEISCVITETFFKCSFCKKENFSSGLLGAYTTASYTRFAVKHLLSSRLPALLIYNYIFLY